MKKLVLALLLVAILAVPVAASGDKNRGDKATGPAVQSHENFCGYECRP